MNLQRIWGLFLKNWWVTLGSMDRLFDLFYWPMLDILTWGLMSHYLLATSIPNLTATILGGIILWLFLWRNGQDMGVYLLEDYWSKNLYHLFASPITIGEHIISLMSIALIRTLISSLFLTLLAYVLYAFNFFSISILFLGLCMMILILFGWFLGLLTATLIVRYGSRIQVISWSVVWIIQPFVCIYYPLSSLPAWAYNIGRFIPVTYVFEGLRAILNGGTLPLSQLMIALASDLFLLFAGFFLLVHALHKARKDGSLAKPE